MVKFIEARFSSTCAETGKPIRKHDSILYDTVTKKVYCSRSKAYQNEAERKSTANMVQANEDAYYDNFCQTNNI